MLVGGIVVVCAAVLPRRAGKRAQSFDNQTVRNMETALEQFMENMEADNRDIAGLVTKSSEEALSQAAKRDERIGQLEKQIAVLERHIAEQTVDRAAIDFHPVHTPTNEGVRKPTGETKVQAVPVAVEIETTDAAVVTEEGPAAPSIRYRYSELFDLYQAGKSIDAIAKKLGRNKGEIQLILQLSKQEEAVRHE
ncbi:gas vesicle protein [Paenibacillus sacheonensis]|nr:gas vesicle protein [Paenibacillus sacheonensis]